LKFREAQGLSLTSPMLSKDGELFYKNYRDSFRKRLAEGVRVTVIRPILY
jgi:hypothetical protein